MKFKVGDKVRVVNAPLGLPVRDMVGEIHKVTMVDNDKIPYELSNRYWCREDDIEPIEDPLADKIVERNNKPNILEGKDMNQPIDDPIEPQHYRNGDKDLFDELYDRLYHSKKTFTGREVFIIVMKFVAERYTRRYPNKNAEDLSKGIYTLERLREYEKLEEEE